MKKHGIKKVISAFVTTLLVLSLCLSFIVVIKSTLTDDPSLFGFRTFYVVSGSMEPTIHTGAVVLVKKCDTYEVGQVITFKSDDPSISGDANTHRIVSQYEENGTTYYITRGDANGLNDDYPVAIGNVYGRVVHATFSMLWLGEFFEFVTTSVGFFFVILLPIFVVAVLLLKDFIKTYRGELEKLRTQAAETSENPVKEGDLQENTSSENAETLSDGQEQPENDEKPQDGGAKRGDCN